LTNARDLI